jgi:hypothetical protein
MLTQLYPFLDPSHINASLTERLRALADDAERLQHTRSVSPSLLQTAPLLEYWVSTQRPEGLRLIGQVTGHPTFGESMIITSPLWFVDPEGNWIRTVSRFYRLGPPANPGEASLICSLKIEPFHTRDDHEPEDDA